MARCSQSHGAARLLAPTLGGNPRFSEVSGRSGPRAGETGSLKSHAARKSEQPPCQKGRRRCVSGDNVCQLRHAASPFAYFSWQQRQRKKKQEKKRKKKKRREPGRRQARAADGQMDSCFDKPQSKNNCLQLAAPRRDSTRGPRRARLSPAPLRKAGSSRRHLKSPLGARLRCIPELSLQKPPWE